MQRKIDPFMKLLIATLAFYAAGELILGDSRGAAVAGLLALSLTLVVSGATDRSVPAKAAVIICSLAVIVLATIGFLDA